MKSAWENFSRQNRRLRFSISPLSRVPAGTPLADALDMNDMILEIDNKSMTNRPDLWGHYGIAREIAAPL